MSVYKKLQQARVLLQDKKMKKSGHNKFAGYSYFELGDFLPSITSIFNELGLCSVVSFDKELATLRIVDIEDGKEVVFTSPMADAMLKGCHPIQNLGAVETYSRRYLFVTALEIVEHDALDSAEPLKPSAKHVELVESNKKVTTSLSEDLTPAQRAIVQAKADEVFDMWDAQDLDGAIETYLAWRDKQDDASIKAAYWHFIDEKARGVRNAMQKHAEAMAKKKAA